MVPAINVFGNRTHELEDKQNLVYIKDNLNNICARPTLALAKELFLLLIPNCQYC